jgi:hypothetical protein
MNDDMNNKNKMRKRRHGYQLVCQTCKSRSNSGGFENPKQFAKIVQEQRRQHHNHDYNIKQSYHAAELTHTFKEKTSRITKLGNTFTDVDATNATIASSFFTAGKKYYIEVTATLDGDNVGNQVLARMVHGSTAFADSSWGFEPNVVATAQMVYNWWTVWTAVSGEAIKLQYNNGSSGGTSGIDQSSIVCFKLSDDLTEDTGSGGDWKTNEVTANTTLTAGAGDSASNNATITFTPATASNIWLIKSKSRWTNALAASFGLTRIVRSGEASSTAPFCQITAEDATNDEYQASLAMTLSLGAASNTFTEKSAAVSGGNITRTHSGIFALNLSKLRNLGQAYADSSVTAITAVGTDIATSPTQIQTASITPGVTGDVWCQVFMTYDCNNSARVLRFRMQVDNTDQPATQTSDNYPLADPWGSTDEQPIAVQSMESLASGSAHTVDLDCVVSSSTSTPGARAKLAFAVSMELPATGSALVTLVPETEAITENVTVWMKHVEAKNETEAITEAVNIRMAHREIKNETEAITENVVAKVVMAPRIVNETEAVTENVVFRLGRLTVVSETVSVGENVVVKMNRITPPVNETEAITEQIVVKVVMAPRIVNETEAVTENVVYRMNMAKVISETESILENVVATVKLPAKTINEVEAITENVVVKLGLSRVINETVAVPENIVVSVRRVNPPINETVSIGENILVKVNRIEPPVNETVSIPEQIVVQVRNVRPPVNETVGITENVIARLGISRPPIDETVTIPENVVVKVSSTIPPINETVDIGENVVIRMNRITPPVDETVAITENVVVRADRINPPINETVGITENIVAALGIVRPPINEPVSIPENVVVKLQLAYPTVNEQVSISEATVFKMDRVNPPVNEIMDIPEDVIVRMDRIELVGEQLSVSENIIVKLETPITKEVNEIVSISENVTIKVEEQEIFPAPVPGGGVPIRRQPLKITRKQRVWPQMSLKTYDPTKYVKQDRRYDPPTLQEQLSAPRTKVRRAFVGVYDILPLSRTQQRILEEEKQLEQLTQTLNETQELVNVPTLPTELDKLLQKTPQKQKPAKVAKSFVAKYDILSKINKSFTGKYDKSTLVSKTFIASYDIKVFDWGRLQMLQNMRTLVAAMSAMDDLESVDDLDVV